MSRILVVDDERLYCSNLKLALERAGHFVEVETDARRAIERAPSFGPEICVTDWMLESALVGPEIVAKLREYLPELKAVLITGYAGVPNPGETHEFDVILRKPFRAQQLIDAVSNFAQVHDNGPVWLEGKREV